MKAAASLYLRFPGSIRYERVCRFVKGRPTHFGKTRDEKGAKIAPQQIPEDYPGKYYIRVLEDGKRVWKAFDQLAAALAARANIQANLDRKQQGLPPIPPPVLTRPSGDALPIADAIKDFIEYSESRIQDWKNGGDNGLSPNSVVAYKKAATDFAKSCREAGAVYMSEFKDYARGKAILLYFKSWLHRNCGRRHGKGAYADSRKFTVIGAFLARHGFKLKKDRTFNPNDPGLLDYRDVPSVKKPTVNDVVFYTPADMRAMLSATNGVHEKSIYLADDLRDLVLTFFWTGMRDEEVQHLTWADVNGAKITVQDKPHDDWRVKDHEKRSISIPPCLAKRLKERREGKGRRAPRNGSERLFPTSTGTANQNFADHVTALQKRAEQGIGQKGRKPYQFSRPEARTHVLHNFRKTYATYQMLKGVTPRNIQRDLGHYELETTERYLATVENPRETLAAFDALK